MVKASVDLDGTEYKVVIRKNEERNFDTSCEYEDTPSAVPAKSYCVAAIVQ